MAFVVPKDDIGKAVKIHFVNHTAKSPLRKDLSDMNVSGFEFKPNLYRGKRIISPQQSLVGQVYYFNDKEKYLSLIVPQTDIIPFSPNEKNVLICKVDYDVIASYGHYSVN